MSFRTPDSSEPSGTPDRRLQILCLAPQAAWPATDGGKEGIYGALQVLARRAEVVYACPCREPSAESLAHYRALGIDYRPVAFMPRDSLRVVLASTLQLKPFKLHKYGNREAVTAFEAALQDARPDAVLCFHAHMGELGQRLRSHLDWQIPLLVREHNIEYELVASYRSALSLPKQLATAPFEWLTRRAEQRLWARADAVAFLSDRDLATAQASGVAGRLLLAREGIPLPPRRPAVHPGSGAPLLVLLNPKATQSVLNLREYLHHGWSAVAGDPRMRATALHVTGVTTERLAELVDMQTGRLQSLRVQGLGFLPSLEKVLATSLALISPTYVGGGIRKKILEAMAHQLPVVATRLDIETCSYFTAGRNILELAAQPERLVEQVVMLQEDPEAWLRLSSEARDTVEVNASWDLFAETVINEITRLKRSLASRTNAKAVG